MTPDGPPEDFLRSAEILAEPWKERVAALEAENERLRSRYERQCTQTQEAWGQMQKVVRTVAEVLDNRDPMDDAEELTSKVRAALDQCDFRLTGPAVRGQRCELPRGHSGGHPVTDVQSLRRAAQHARATPGQLGVGIDLDNLANRLEAGS